MSVHVPEHLKHNWGQSKKPTKDEGEGAEQEEEEEEEDDDPVDAMLKKAGCLELHRDVQNCMAEHRDWRQCQSEVSKFRECVAKNMQQKKPGQS